MSRGEELKPPLSAAAPAPADKITTTAAAAESTKRPHDDADCVGEIDEDDAARKVKTSRTTGVGLRTNKTPPIIHVFFNGLLLAQLRDKISVENALKVLRKRARCGETAEVWLEDKNGCDAADRHLSVDYSPYDFYTEQAIPPPVEPEFAYENELKGQLLRYGPPTYDENFIESYRSQASTFRPSTAREDEVGERPARFRAFLGPSGSGKTFSAIKKPFERPL